MHAFSLFRFFAFFSRSRCARARLTLRQSSASVRVRKSTSCGRRWCVRRSQAKSFQLRKHAASCLLRRSGASISRSGLVSPMTLDSLRRAQSISSSCCETSTQNKFDSCHTLYVHAVRSARGCALPDITGSHQEEHRFDGACAARRSDAQKSVAQRSHAG
jgi:hypothetical protein